MTDLEPLKAALAAATPGPWVNGSHNEHGVVRSPEHGLIAQCGPYGKQDADARLIVAAVNALPALIAEVEALREVREAARAIIASDLDVAGRRYVVASDDPDMDALRAALIAEVETLREAP